MTKINSPALLSPVLKKIKNLRHGFGTKNFFDPSIILAKQVHGTEILTVHEIRPHLEENGFDILITSTPGVVVGVKTADCLPILIADPICGIVAAVHAGWRGTAARAVQKTIERLSILGSKKENLYVCLGPCIGASCYEVGEDVSEAFGGKFLEKKANGKWLLDLQAANRQQILDSEVPQVNIDQLYFCTHCREDLFHSYRRDAAQAGRMVNFIGIA